MEPVLAGVVEEVVLLFRFRSGRRGVRFPETGEGVGDWCCSLLC